MERSTTLWQIVDEVQCVMDRVMSSDGEITEDLEKELDSLELALTTKAEAVALYVRNLKTEALAIKAEEDRLKTRRQSRENAASRMEDYLHRELERAERDKVETPLVTISIRKNSRPSITWGVGEIPEPFRRTVSTLDGSAAYEAWRAGALPPGFTVITGTHLRIS